MAFDFPASPTNNQTFTPPGGATYTFNGVSWIPGGTPAGSAPLADPIFTGDPRAPTPALPSSETGNTRRRLTFSFSGGPANNNNDNHDRI